MRTYDFTFVIGNADPHANDFEDRFFEAGCDDSTLVLMHGAVAACFSRAAPTFKDAVFSAYQDIQRAGASIERFEPDYLVSASEIAKRAGITAQAVSLYAKGDRGNDFPRPRIRVTTPNPLWDWVEVSHWLVRRGTVAEEEYREAQLSRIINFGSQAGQNFATIVHQAEEALAEAV